MNKQELFDYDWSYLKRYVDYAEYVKHLNLFFGAEYVKHDSKNATAKNATDTASIADEDNMTQNTNAAAPKTD